EGKDERERREDARLVEDDRGRIDSADLRDEREPAVPERKGVAGVEPAVLELVDGAQRERAEVVELADATEMEERVAFGEPLDPPQSRTEPDSGERNQAARARDRLAPRAPRERHRDGAR